MDEIDIPEEFEEEEVEIRCQYVFKRGKQKGQRCTVKKWVDPTIPYCTKHSKLVEGKQSKQSSPISSPKQLSPSKISPPKLNPKKSISRDSQEPSLIQILEPSAPPVYIPNQPIPEEDPNVDVIYLDTPDPPKQQRPKPKKPIEQIKQEILQDQSTKVELSEPEKPSVDTDTMERQIVAYYTLIPTLASELPYESRGDASPQEWLKEIDKHICQKSGDSAILIGFRMVTGLVEAVGTSKGYKLHGYSNMMTADPEVQNLLNLIKLRNINRFSEVSPEMVLLGMCATQALSLHTIGGRPELNQNPSILDQMKAEQASRQPKFKE